MDETDDRLQFAVVRWIDSASATHGWEAPEGSTPGQSILWAAGLVVGRTETHLILAVSYDPVSGLALNQVEIWLPSIVSNHLQLPLSDPDDGEEE